MKFPTTIKFNDEEWYIINDRLEVADCIAEALADDIENEEDQAEYNHQVYTAAESMWKTGNTVIITNDLDLSVLADCVEGSTMPPKLMDKIDFGTPEEKKAARKKKAYFKTIEAKLEKAGIHGVKFSKY